MGWDGIEWEEGRENILILLSGLAISFFLARAGVEVNCLLCCGCGCWVCWIEARRPRSAGVRPLGTAGRVCGLNAPAREDRRGDRDRIVVVGVYCRCPGRRKCVGAKVEVRRLVSRAVILARAKTFFNPIL